MKWVVRSIRWFATTTLLLVSVVACSDNENLTTASNSITSEIVSLDVYKSRTCGCCKKWISHIDDFGFESEVRHPANLSKIKADKGDGSKEKWVSISSALEGIGEPDDATNLFNHICVVAKWPHCSFFTLAVQFDKNNF